jgi:class 3 adenylate cyclase
MASAPARRDVALEQPPTRYPWVLGLVIVVGVIASLSVSYTLYRSAERQWIARSESEAQRLSTMLLGWIDDSYAPLSGLAALVETSGVTDSAAFLNALDGMESRATAVVLGAVAMLQRDARGRWVLTVSSGNFEFLERDAARGFVELQPVIAMALVRRNQFVLGPPVPSGGGTLISPVLIAISNVKTPTLLVGALEYETLESALRGTPIPKGFYLTLKGKFTDAPKIRPIIAAHPDRPLVEELATRASTAGADLEIVWGVTREYANGPDYALAAMMLIGGATATVLIASFIASLIERNRVINAEVQLATAALRDKNVELARAHELVRHAFGRYVSEEVAESLLRAPEALDLGGEEREASILLSDLRGFTAMAARLHPHEVIEVLNLYLEAMVDVIGRYQGTIDEIVGDGILVIFGAPVACQDHAEKAVACGLAMQLAMTEVNRRLVAKGGAEVEMGIGVHTGRVVVGNIGSLRRTKYAAVGANVNLVGRIQSFTTGGQLLISEDTHRNIKSPLRIDGQYVVEPNGVARSVLLYEIGGIGQPFGLALPSTVVPLRPLAMPLPVQFTVLEEKFVGRTVHPGQLTALSAIAAGMESHLTPMVLSNLQITVATTPLGNPAGEIYGKAVESFEGTPGRVKIRFSSVTPELKTWMRTLSM